eukprot:m.74257 g.74257  ORF g.74257 m.74257 type:complete len:72 (-) comp12453_c0_seq4:4388-4603(-)
MNCGQDGEGRRRAGAFHTMVSEIYARSKWIGYTFSGCHADFNWNQHNLRHHDSVYAILRDNAVRPTWDLVS